MTKFDIEDRMDDKVKALLLDDDYLYEAVWFALTDLREAMNATTLDDKLSALYELTTSIDNHFRTSTLRDECIAELEIEAIPNEATKYESNRHD